MEQRNGFPYSERLVSLVIETHLPTKWLFVDQETGDVWQWNLGKGDNGGWSRADKEVSAAIRASLQR